MGACPVWMPLTSSDISTQGSTSVGTEQGEQHKAEVITSKQGPLLPGNPKCCLEPRSLPYMDCLLPPVHLEGSRSWSCLVPALSPAQPPTPVSPGCLLAAPLAEPSGQQEPAVWLPSLLNLWCTIEFLFEELWLSKKKKRYNGHCPAHSPRNERCV